MNQEQSSKKYIQIADLIIDEINKGTWKEGEAIPTVRRLAEIYGVSPQTANKATTHLAGLGIIASRQGSGSLVTGKKSALAGPEIPMLIDKARSSYLRGEDTAVGYHGKELYLNYLHEMKEEGMEPHLLVYDKRETVLPEETKNILLRSKGTLVQGSLPDCYIDFLEKNDIPLVLINRSIHKDFSGRIGSVMMDNGGLEQLSAYVASLGHEKFIFAFSNEFEMTSVYDNRLKVIGNTLEENCRNAKPEISEFHFTPGSNKDSLKLKELIDKGATAILCYNDICALRIYDLLHQQNIRVPEEVSVSGFDDLFMAEMAAPPLTTVKVNRNQLICSSLSLLKELITRTSPCREEGVSETSLVIRRSCWQKRSAG
ncbi:MAG: LacI family DNA-binding transcriptional regulator [Spirochaetales bacterium]|nr:LacI family DNA-binding transcriptional regulator [Spirochaetales bacterium]